MMTFLVSRRRRRKRVVRGMIALQLVLRLRCVILNKK
jgi:hypothetical protein